ncbi:MAG: sigma-54 dependent transcriptional regulator [Balneolales bacterium]
MNTPASHKDNTFGITGESPAIRQVIEKIKQVAPTDISILLQGETGVGKDVTAKAIHGMSKRKDNNLVIVNCGAIPEGIIESELFGHEKGSYTGAHDSRKGYFEKADGGTIFLDEIADTPKNIQVKLLRVLETGEFFRVGSSEVRTADVRVIAASNRDLWSCVTSGDFREDLYYRLDTINIKIPPLRERQEDIILIFRQFVNEFAARYDSTFQGFSDEARNLLVSYRWPGNIRELKNVAEQMVVLEKSQYITAEILQKYLKGRQHEGSADNLPVLFKRNNDGSENNKQQSGNYQQHAGNNQGLKDQELMYRALVELRNEISDLKKMFGSFIYSSFANGGMSKSLPLPQNHEDEVHKNQKVGWPGKKQSNGPVEMNKDEHNEFQDFFDQGDLPSLEETEKFLIQKALTKYNGSRRKAAEVLGMSERTLYRKLDQYELD